MTTPPTPDAGDASERFDNAAELFYAETHVMAPGKDVAAPMGGYDAYDMRVKLWRMWLEKRTLTAQLAAAKADGERLSEVVLWALGERDEFPDPVEGKPRRLYWWRTEMRKRFDAARTGAR
jgi:hypothetical protein